MKIFLLTTCFLTILKITCNAQTDFRFSIEINDSNGIFTSDRITVRVLNVDSVELTQSISRNGLAEVVLFNQAQNQFIFKVDQKGYEIFNSEIISVENNEKYKVVLVKRQITTNQTVVPNASKTNSTSTSQCASVQCSGRTKKGARCKNKTTNCNGNCHLH